MTTDRKGQQTERAQAFAAEFIINRVNWDGNSKPIRQRPQAPALTQVHTPPPVAQPQPEPIQQEPRQVEQRTYRILDLVTGCTYEKEATRESRPNLRVAEYSFHRDESPNKARNLNESA